MFLQRRVPATKRSLSLRAAPGEPFPEAVRRLGVKFVLFSWTDLFGVMVFHRYSFARGARAGMGS